MTYKHGLREVKYKYGLHDTEINKISCTDFGIILEFNNGVHLLDNTGKETELSNKCYLELRINFFDNQKIYEHITIKRIRKNMIKEIEHFEFEKMLAKSAFNVDLDYYSPFADSLLIKGFMDKDEIEIVVTEISEFLFTFDN